MTATCTWSFRAKARSKSSYRRWKQPARTRQQRSDMKATRLELFQFRTPAMRAFHVTWVSFFLCFFGWFGVAPLMPIIRAELKLTAEQIGNIVIASVAVTVLARLGVGWLCDRFGPRRVYAGLLTL